MNTGVCVSQACGDGLDIRIR